MYLNRKHPDFDLSMELLACLTIEPDGVPMVVLRRDLGLLLQLDIHPLIRSLCKKFDIFVMNQGYESKAGTGRVVCISMDHKVEARQAAQEYWDKVNGETV